jgi:hypothetical protein
MPQSRTPNALESRNPFLDADIPDTEEIYEPTPFGISALTNVDHLMNDVFQNIEQMLERGAVLPTDLHEEPASPPAAPLVMPSFVLTPPPPIEPVEPVATHLGLSEDLMNDPDLEELLSMEQNKPTQKRGSNVLLSALLATVLLTGGLFIGFKYRLWTLIPGLTPATQVSANPATEPVPGTIAPSPNKDQQFLNYVGRSLDRIDRTTANRTPNAPSVVPTVPAAPSASPSASPTVVERYVPVYQPPLFGAFTNKPTVPNTPIAAAPVPPAASSPARAAAPARAASAPVPVPAAPAPTMTAAPSPVAAVPAPNFDPNETHSIIGLLELGDRSAALLTVNGVPQRIEVGGKIGASGWQLVSVSNQAAIIQRNSEVRSVYVGQQF